MATTKILVNSDGPLRVEGDFEIVDPQGNVFGLAGRTRISLCRCGHSNNKPFCDGSHKTSGFQNESVACEFSPPAPKP
jgi:CDGSH-type Zn-finger protein